MKSVEDGFDIFPFGRVTGRGIESFFVDERSVEAIRRHQEEKGIDIVIDYEHQSLSGQIAPAAGWIKRFFNKHGQALACTCTWTEKARQLIKNGEYKYYSPVVLLDRDRRLVDIHSIALTNIPIGDRLTPLAMKRRTEGDEEEFCVFVSLPLYPTKEGEEVIPPIEVKGGLCTHKEGGKDVKEIAQVLGMSENSSEQEIVEALKEGQTFETLIMSTLGITETGRSDGRRAAIDAVNRLKNAAPGYAEIMKELGMEPGTNTTQAALGVLWSLKQKANSYNPNEILLLKEELNKHRAEELVGLAMSQGKITAAQREWAMTCAKTNYDGFRSFIENAPVVIIMGNDPVNSLSSLKREYYTITDEDRRIMKQFGLTEEQLKKYN